jgi:hypothetical protein
MATVLEERIKEEVRAVILFFMGKIFPRFEIYRELVTVYSGSVMAVHVRKWCREFGSSTVVELM